ncbi:hypothetical protein XH94_08650 [Bradyrhizobium zhanjiangense]|uniref:NIL domain-containing protein n=1 Tax=Bradyrhizobium zhanjiangense TaxID=1325107 RepID=A0A4Q0SRF5_9BRAD|nr:hypothetical protein XH94_08650 [Bradyrhizobium zhanjiangense]
MKATTMNAHQSLAIGQPIQTPEAISPAELGLDVALLSARIDEISGQHVGSLVLGIPFGMSGGEDAATRTLAWLSQYQFPAERLGHVA